MVPDRFALAAELRDEKLKAERAARITEIEDRIFDRASGVVEAALAFHEVTPNQQEPPPDWVAEYGPEGAQQRLAVAKSGWMPSSVAPASVRLAAQVMVGIQRGRAYRGQHIGVQNNLNVKIALPAPTSAQHPEIESPYPVKVIE